MLELATEFEYEMASFFISFCLRTTYPEHRQNLLKELRLFMIRLRTSLEKSIKKDTQLPEVRRLAKFLNETISVCFSNLSLDKPIESASPYFEVLKMVLELFGDTEYKVKMSQVY